MTYHAEKLRQARFRERELAGVPQVEGSGDLQAADEASCNATIAAATAEICRRHGLPVVEYGSYLKTIVSQRRHKERTV